MRYFHVSIPATALTLWRHGRTIDNVQGVSAFDAALRTVTRLATNGDLPHGVPVTVWVDDNRRSVDVTVTPTGRTLADEVAA